MRKAYNTIKAYNSAGYLETEGANAILLKNEGDVTVRVNTLLTIAPGESMSIAQVSADVADHTQYSIEFDNSHPLTTGSNNLLAVVCIGIYR
ncbi:MAG: hypothetical protein LCH58_06100 [Bacteroidetes bacterium]|jgi:hypothetical protein|uniref:hypothetical protein n=1 Tax=Phnomibacter sp. TaxID=2836217 RepID=UPI002FDCBB75|nr:hypothetical protein [Bacteroidota bacterium]